MRTVQQELGARVLRALERGELSPAEALVELRALRASEPARREEKGPALLVPEPVLRLRSEAPVGHVGGPGGQPGPRGSGLSGPSAGVNLVELERQEQARAAWAGVLAARAAERAAAQAERAVRHLRRVVRRLAEKEVERGLRLVAAELGQRVRLSPRARRRAVSQEEAVQRRVLGCVGQLARHGLRQGTVRGRYGAEAARRGAARRPVPGLRAAPRVDEPAPDRSAARRERAEKKAARRAQNRAARLAVGCGA